MWKAVVFEPAVVQSSLSIRHVSCMPFITKIQKIRFIALYRTRPPCVNENQLEEGSGANSLSCALWKSSCFKLPEQGLCSPTHSTCNRFIWFIMLLYRCII